MNQELKSIQKTLPTELIPEYAMSIKTLLIEHKQDFEKQSKIFNQSFFDRFSTLIQNAEQIIDNKTFVSERFMLTNKMFQNFKKLEILLTKSSSFINKIDTEYPNISETINQLTHFNYTAVNRYIDTINNYFRKNGRQLRDLPMPASLLYDIEDTIDNLTSIKLMISSLNQTQIDLSNEEKALVNNLWYIIQTITDTATIIYKSQQSILDKFTYGNIVKQITNKQLDQFNSSLHKAVS